MFFKTFLHALLFFLSSFGLCRGEKQHKGNEQFKGETYALHLTCFF